MIVKFWKPATVLLVVAALAAAAAALHLARPHWNAGFKAEYRQQVEFRLALGGWAEYAGAGAKCIADAVERRIPQARMAQLRGDAEPTPAERELADKVVVGCAKELGLVE